MRKTVLLFFCVASALAAKDVELPLAEQCDEELCQLPDCRCSSTNIPGGLSSRDTPQFVTVTFTDGVTTYDNTMDTYRSVLYGRRNNNGCPSGATFFLSHADTNYRYVNELYNQGFEVALYSMSGRQVQNWQEVSYDDLVEQFADQRKQMAHFANIPIDDIKGVRIPNFQLSGNNSYLMIKNNGLVYDSSWYSNFFSHPLWPYTLDYASTQDCPKGPCPSASIPGVWVLPPLPWRDLSGNPCIMVNECVDVPDLYDTNAWYQFILSNFERHYLNNRAPFGLYASQYYFNSYPAIESALSRFLDLVNRLEDAFVVNANEVLDWVKNPVSISEYKNKPCRSVPSASCQRNTCDLEHGQSDYEMEICTVCPRVFPWLGNPLGE